MLPLLTTIVAAPGPTPVELSPLLLEFLLLVLVAIGALFIGFFLIAKRLTHSLNRQVRKKASEAETALKELTVHKETSYVESEQLRMVTEAMHDGVVVTDAEGKIEVYSSALSFLTGVENKNALGESIDDVLTFRNASKEYPSLFGDVLRKERVASPPDTILVASDGQPVDVSYSASILKTPSGDVHGMIAVIRNVAHEREVSRLKSEFVSLSSHQLRTPLTTMKWTLETLLESEASSNVPIPVLEQLNVIKRSNARMIGLVESILDLQKIESGEAKLMMQDVSFDALVREALQEMEAMLTKANVSIELDVKHEGEFPTLHLDGYRMKEVLHAVLENAVLVSSPGESVHVTLSVSRKDKEIDLTIADKGPAFPWENKAGSSSRFTAGSSCRRRFPTEPGWDWPWRSSWWRRRTEGCGSRRKKGTAARST